MTKLNWKAISAILFIVVTMVGYIYAEGTGSRDRDTKITTNYTREDITIRQEQTTAQKETNQKLEKILLALGELKGTVGQIATSR